jgi:DNA repair exonuclease SbcCD ATPase subunit
MIVRSIRVADWRCFLNAVEVGPFDDGLNIIHAPNATGKSTLFEAFRRALLDGHKVTGKDVEAIRPWGRELAPKVTVEFAHQGREYRISKQFLDNQSALLERKENGKYQRLAEGVAADDKTREILTKNPPGRGLCRPENWGVAQVLWAPQGNLALETLSGDLIADIRAMLCVQVSGAGTGSIEKRIEERYLEVFSPKGKVKTGKEAPLLVRLKYSLAEAEETRRKAWEQYLAFEDASRRVEELQARRVQARYDTDAISKSLRHARAVAETYGQLVAERAQRSEKVTAAEAQYKEIKQRIEAIKSTELELGEARKALETLKGEIPLKEREVQEREQEVARLKAALEDARKGRETVEFAKRLADTARRFNECSRKLAWLDELIEKVKEAEKMLADRRQKRNAFVAPDAKVLRAVRKAIKDGDDAQVRIDASLITLEIVPKKAGSIEVITGEVTGMLSLKPDVPALIKGSPEVVADIPEVARLRTWGPVGSVEEHREARAKAHRQLKDLMEPYGTSDIDELELMADKKKELDNAVTEAETKVQMLLSGTSLDELAQDRSILATTLSGFLDTYPDWEKDAPDSQALEAEADETEQAFIVTVESAEAAWEKAQTALTAVAGHKETLARRLEDALRQEQSFSSKLSELTSDGKSQQEKETELQRVTMTWEAASARLQEIDKQLEAYEDDPGAVVDRLETQLEGANQASNQAREHEVREETRLENLCAQGPYSALAVAEEKLAQLEQDVKKEELRVDAIKALYETVAACRNEAIASVSGPVEVAATRILQRIAGRRLGSIKVGDGFVPSGVVPELMDDTVHLDNLSGGEQEQLYLATRLALADVLRKDELQMVVLDDVLTSTDTGRLAKVMNILEEAAQRLQLLILTCHPERYRGLKSGHFFDLEPIVRGSMQ